MADYQSDPRPACKYGSTCYRTNKEHIENFKHPSKQETHDSVENPSKKPRLEETNLHQKKPHMKHRPISPPKRPAHCEPSQTSVSNSSTERKSGNEAESSTNRRGPTNNHSILIKEKHRSTESIKLELKEHPEDTIKQLFLVEMPGDFFSFWEMCKTLNKTDPSNALKDVKLKLVGPFDVLAGKTNIDIFEEDLPDFLRHWRFYYDPPEFQTVLSCNDARCLHFGYYRDEPREMPVFVASNMLHKNNVEKNGELKVVAPNLFAAFNAYLEDLKVDPFSRMKVPKFQKLLTKWANDNGFSLEKTVKSRKVVAKTFHGAGIVVPVDKKNDVGYRELAATNSMIKKMLKGIVESKSEEERTKYWEQLQPVITFANIANDECDFGTSLELGLDLFSYGSPLLHRTARQLLTTAYSLLGRDEFATIIQAHLENRREGGNLSVL